MIGQTLGAYTVQRELGRGGMGAVYVGVHGLLGRTAAIKVLLPEMSKNQDVVQRFFNEARAATAIRHAGIVEVYDFGWSTDGNAYIVMEFLDGESLSVRLRRLGRLPPVFALGVARQTALALAAAHKAGIIHRDLKPDNVFLVPDVETSIGERVKLLDFGIAKLAGDPDSPNSARTTTGAIMGTPYYMSPEQCKGAAQVDHRSDIYSLGCMLHQMCCGTVPFLGEGAGDIIGKHIYVAPTPLRQIASDTPPEIEALVLRLLAKSPADRPASAEAVAQEIGQLVTRLAASPQPPVASLGVAATLPAGAVPPISAPVPAPSVPVITTMSSAATEVPKPTSKTPKRRLGMFLGLGGIGLVAIVAIVELVTPLGGKKTDTVAHETPADAKSLTPPPPPPPPVASPDAATENVQAEHEAEVQAAYSEFHVAINKPDYEAAAAAYAKIPADSALKQQAKDIGEGEVNGHAEKLAKAGKCKELDVFAKQVAKAWPDASTTAIALGCKPKGHTGATAGDIVANAPKGDADANDAEKIAVEDLVKRANSAFMISAYAQALSLAEMALQHDATNASGLMTAALSACNLRNRPKAKLYIEKLAAGRRARPLLVCKNNGIDFSGAAE